MKGVNNYVKRLYALAVFLQRYAIVEQMFHEPKKYNTSLGNIGIPHYHWLFAQLPRVFPGGLWRIANNGDVYLAAAPKLNCLAAAALFFNLSSEEAIAIFCSDHDFYPGDLKKLPRDAGPGTLAYQVFALMMYKQKEFEIKEQKKNERLK